MKTLCRAQRPSLSVDESSHLSSLNNLSAYAFSFSIMLYLTRLKMATKKLLIENDYEFSLIGISSHSKDYRLCWSLNNQLQTKFEKRNDLIVELVKQRELSHFSIFEFEDEENFNTHFIIANNGSSGLLLPEHKNLDYFWMVKGFFTKANCIELLQNLNSIEAIITSIQLDVSSLKSKQNLIF